MEIIHIFIIRMKHIIFLFFIVIAFVSCNKEYTTKTRTEYLTTGKWYLRQATAKITVPGQEETFNLLEDMPDCVNDDATVFETDGTITVDDNFKKCDGASQEKMPIGHWQLVRGDSFLTTIFNGLPITGDICQMDANYTCFIWKGSYKNLSAKFKVVYSHQN